jgi:DNA-binding HxlR family transcriptional regulator
MLSDLTKINNLLDVLSAKWTTEILRELSVGPVRTSVFLHHIPGLTMKCLRQRLVELEKLGFVNRKEYDQRPLKVEYTITERGTKLIVLMTQIKLLSDELSMNGAMRSANSVETSANKFDCAPGIA